MNISIIVPVYNGEKYLRDCVDGILGQTVSDLEILLIDDGSTDGSGAICDAYATKDKRVRVFHKENGGVSSARNLGLDNARGEWIAFVDSDDLVTPNFCEIMMDNKSEDLIVCSFETLGNTEDKYILKDRCLSKKGFSIVINDYLSNIHFTTSWGKLFKKSILESCKLRFHQNINSAEDTLFVYEYLQHISSILIKSDIAYLYRQTDGGLSHKNLSVDMAIDTITTVVFVMRSLEKEYDTSLSCHLYNLVNYIYIRSIRFVQGNYSNILQRWKVIKTLHSHLPLCFLKEYSPALMGVRGKLFYFLARKEYYLLLSVYSYYLAI